VTPELLAACTGASLAKARELEPFMTATMAEFAIETPLRQAAFLAQVGHESGGFVWMHEIWGPTEAQLRYEPPSDLATHLGNTQPGDGKRYMGRGPIQITGRFNYRLMGPKLGLDLEQFPALLEEPMHACRSAGAFWQWKGCEVFADANDFVGLTRRINGGTNGIADRLARWSRAKNALGIR
jgi:putative chitinase